MFDSLRMARIGFILLTSFTTISAASEQQQEPQSALAGAAGGSAIVDDYLSEEISWYIKRQVMSKPGVMLDMANMTDSGYTWANDVVWMGSGLPVDEPWYIAGFVFQRPGYKSVWLQYAFTYSEATGNLGNFKRWYGAGTFR